MVDRKHYEFCLFVFMSKSEVRLFLLILFSVFLVTLKNNTWNVTKKTCHEHMKVVFVPFMVDASYLP